MVDLAHMHSTTYSLAIRSRIPARLTSSRLCLPASPGVDSRDKVAAASDEAPHESAALAPGGDRRVAAKVGKTAQRSPTLVALVVIR